MKAWWLQSNETLAAPINAIPEAYCSRGEANIASATKTLEVKRLNLGQLNGQAEESMVSWEQALILTGELSTEIKLWWGPGCRYSRSSPSLDLKLIGPEPLSSGAIAKIQSNGKRRCDRDSQWQGNELHQITGRSS